MAIKNFVLSTCIFAFQVSAFSLYPTVNSDSLAKSFGISMDCLDALNETLPCDQTLFQMSNTVDSYLWTTENVTDLCTPDCMASTVQWWSDVQSRCATDHIAAYGKMIPAETIAGRFVDGLSIACLQSSTSSNSSVPTGSGTTSNITSASTGAASYSNSSLASNLTSSKPSWCLIESQKWVGSDIIRPDCSTNSTDPSCHDPLNVSPEHERIANLYPNDVLCSDCFIRIFHKRMSSPYLPDSDYSDYLVAQYQDILDVCEASMPDLVVRDLPFYGDAPVTFDAKPSSNSSVPSFLSNGTRYTNGSNDSTACTGQIIPIANLTDPAFSTVNVSFCDIFSKKYGVTTGDLGAILENPFCEPIDSSYCVPAACSLLKVPSGATCDSISSANSITTLQFRNWNPNINGLCDKLQEGDYVCIGAPGGSYIPPRIKNVSTNATAQQPGGSDSSASDNSTGPYRNSTAPTTTSASPNSGSSDSGPAAPSPTQKGIPASCTKYGQAKHGDYCSTFAQDNSITLPQLYALNAALGSAGENCNTAFWSGYYYCVASNATPALGGSSNSSSTTTDTTAIPSIDSAPTSTTAPIPVTTALSTVMSTAIVTVDARSPYISTSTPDAIPTPVIANHAAPLPSPLQQGVSSLCAKYAQAHTGDTCPSFAAANGISPIDLYGRNTALGAKGENCGTKFWAGYYYCVGGTD